jgi:hypothetical protein
MANLRHSDFTLADSLTALKVTLFYFTKHTQLSCVTCISIVTCTSDCRRGVDWMLHLLTIYMS